MRGRGSVLPVKLAEEGEVPRAGTIYLAPAARHLVVRADGSFHLMDGMRIHFTTSSANPLFQSAAYSLDGHVLAVVLTGGGSNGVQGVQTIKGMGGTVIAQDPATAEAPSMPRAAIDAGAVGFVLPLDQIAAKIASLVRS
jgi:two-component system, chemotaxis family, protein-glutamate methylesterase/glutaminase